MPRDTTLRLARTHLQGAIPLPALVQVIPGTVDSGRLVELGFEAGLLIDGPLVGQQPSHEQ